MQHLNSNLLCAVAARSTGYEMMEMAVVPLTSRLKVSRDHLPCNLLLRPDHPENATCSKELLNYAIHRGIQPNDAAELFEGWFDKLGLPDRKQIMVLTHNWNKHRVWFVDWLQYTAFKTIFHEEVRDIQSVALWQNDYQDRKVEPCPFPKVKLSYLGATLKVDYVSGLPTVIDEIQAIVNVYRELVYRNLA